MNQIYSVENYIESRVIGRQEHMMDGGGMYDDTPWFRCSWEQENNIKRNPEYGCVLHKKMLPYYGMYLNGDTRLCKKNMENIRLFMKIQVSGYQVRVVGDG